MLRWDTAHQKWSNLLQSTDDSAGNSTANDSVPVEIDRVAKGRGRGNKGKGKQNKGNAKGKSKSAGKDKGKGRTLVMKLVANLGKENHQTRARRVAKEQTKHAMFVGRLDITHVTVGVINL